MPAKVTKTKKVPVQVVPDIPELPEDMQLRLLNANMERIIKLLEAILEKNKQGLFDVSKWYK
jgi:hypothetical protein